MRRLLIVVDMQNDFVDGALGTAEAVAILPAVKARIEAAKETGEDIIFTRDTHQPNYMETQEGRKLPVPHCIENTPGWEIVPQLRELTAGCLVIDKPTFGSVKLGEILTGREDIEAITLIGLCTDICVISNALILKAFFPEAEITVDASCCAGVTPDTHNAALAAMKMCQIHVIGE